MAVSGDLGRGVPPYWTLLGVAVDETWAARLGDSVPDWPAFSDSSAALAVLAEQYRLIIVSNVHRAGFAASNSACRASSRRSSPPRTSARTSRRTITSSRSIARWASLGSSGVGCCTSRRACSTITCRRVVADSTSVWINRRHDRSGWGATPEPSDEYSYGLEFASMREFADAVEIAFSAGRVS